MFSTMVWAQVTAIDYFSEISAYYTTVVDMTAKITITRGESEEIGSLSYKSPNNLKIEFSQPNGVVFNTNNDELLLWVPQHSVTFSQELRSLSDNQIAAMVSADGLQMLSQNYAIAYMDSPESQRVEDISEQCIVLRLTWRTTNAGYKEIILYIGETSKQIKKIVGITTQHERIEFLFENIAVNEGVPLARFDYEPPPRGNSIENFLFEPGQ